MGTDNPRFKRYHAMVSAPELWNAEAVAKALAVLKAQERVSELRQEPVDGAESRSERSDDRSPGG